MLEHLIDFLVGYCFGNKVVNPEKLEMKDNQQESLLFEKNPQRLYVGHKNCEDIVRTSW